MEAKLSQKCRKYINLCLLKHKLKRQVSDQQCSLCWNITQCQLNMCVCTNEHRYTRTFGLKDAQFHHKTHVDFTHDILTTILCDSA